MEPIHPPDSLESALIPVVLLAIGFWLTLELGWWDKFIAIAVDYFPLWNWGG